MDAVFEYRNASLHQGYEWSRDKQEDFRKKGKDRKWNKWSVEHAGSAETSLIVLRDRFVTDSLAAAVSLARSLRDVKEEIEGRPGFGDITAKRSSA